MRGIAAASDQQQGSALATPIQHFQFHVFIDSDELSRVGRRMRERGFRRCASQCQRQGPAALLPGSHDGIAISGDFAIEAAAY